MRLHRRTLRGPIGVALLTAELRRQLDEKANEVSALRAAAVAEMLRDGRSLLTVGKILGIGKTAIDKINRRAPDVDGGLMGVPELV